MNEDELDFGDDEELDFGDAPVKAKPVTKKKEKKKPAKKEFERTHEFFQDPEFARIFDEFEESRKEMKKPLTNGARSRLIIKAHKMSEGDIKIATALFNQSIERQWLTLYALLPENMVAKPKADAGLRNDVIK